MKVHEAIRAATPLIETALAGLAPAPSVAWDNTQTPDSEADRQARVTYRVDESRLAQVGAAKTDRTLIVAIVQLRYPKNVGLGEVMAAGDTIKAAFRGSSAGGLSWSVGSVQPVGLDGDRYLVNVTLPFETEHTE